MNNDSNFQVASDEFCADETVSGRWSLNLPTLGGKQFWSDQLHFHRWRIQRHATNGKHRLLDPAGYRYANGSFADCQAALNLIRKKNSMTEMAGDVVVVLHGLIRTRRSMYRMCRYIESNSNCQVLNVGYASTRASIADHAKSLASILRFIPEVRRISFVAHSLGNIVVRHMLADLQNGNSEGIHSTKFHRMVMLGPPNHGSQFASKLHRRLAFRILYGQSGQQLGVDWAATEKRLAIPQFDFAIIAGGQRTWLSPKNPLLPGPDDWVVSVEETRLNTAADFAVRPVTHTWMMNNRWVQAAVLNFLKQGRLEGFGNSSSKNAESTSGVDHG